MRKIAQYERVMAAFLASPKGWVSKTDLESVEDIVPNRLSVYLWESKEKGGAVIIRQKENEIKGYLMSNRDSFPFADPSTLALVVETEAPVAVVTEQPQPEAVVPETVQQGTEPAGVQNIVTNPEPEPTPEPVLETVTQGEAVLDKAHAEAIGDIPEGLRATPKRGAGGKFVKKNAA